LTEIKSETQSPAATVHAEGVTLNGAEVVTVNWVVFVPRLRTNTGRSLVKLTGTGSENSTVSGRSKSAEGRNRGKGKKEIKKKMDDEKQDQNDKAKQ
jgi:hypothetical protein